MLFLQWPLVQIMACKENSPVRIFVFLTDVYSIDVYKKQCVVKQKKSENESELTAFQCPCDTIIFQVQITV